MSRGGVPHLPDRGELLSEARLDLLVPLGKLCPQFPAWEPLPSASFPVLLPVSLLLRGPLHFAMNPVLRMAVSLSLGESCLGSAGSLFQTRSEGAGAREVAS